jgi:uncharacterized cupredoxin-like copper-binding protein
MDEDISASHGKCAKFNNPARKARDLRQSTAAPFIKSHINSVRARHCCRSRHNTARRKPATPYMYRLVVFHFVIVGFLMCGSVSAQVPHAHEADESTVPDSSHARHASSGREGDSRKVQRVIRVDMSDTMRYFPDQLRVRRGETVRFIIRNRGKMPHEMVLGSMDELKKHSLSMQQDAAMHHATAGGARVSPGGTGRLVWQFTKAGEFYYGCLIPGHFEAGMIGTVVVR